MELILAVDAAREVVANAFDELHMPVGAPSEQVASTFRALSLQRALGLTASSSSSSARESDPLLDQTEYKPEHTMATVRPLTPATGEEASERASGMLDFAITSMEQAQRAWGLPYTNYVVTVHYWLCTHVVRRRYSEFLVLHQVLQKNLLVVPTMPETVSFFM